MKKILFIATLLIAGLGYSQAPQITDAQLENSRIIKEKSDKFNTLIEQKVDQIMNAANLKVNLRGALQEIIADKETQIASIERENITDVMKQSKINDVRDNFDTQLKSLVGEEKFNIINNTLSPK